MAEEQQQPSFQIEKIYVKDLSLEVPARRRVPRGAGTATGDPGAERVAQFRGLFEVE